MIPDSAGVFKRHPFILVGIALMLAEFAIGVFVYRMAVVKEQVSLLDRAQTVAAALDTHEILELSGTSADLGTEAYDELKQKLMRVAIANSDVTSVYVTGYRNGDVFFFADSVATGEVDEATPGLVYDEATPFFKAVFTGGRTLVEGPISDRWGSWVSAIVPILDPATGTIIASVGLDVNSQTYIKNIIIATAVPVLLFGIAFLIGLLLYIRYTKNREVLTLRAKFVSIASHELRSPVAGIVWAADALLAQKGRSMTIATRQVVGQISKTGKKVLGTVNEILELSKLQGVQSGRVSMNGVDLALLIREVAESLSLVAKQAKVSVVIDQTLPEKLLTVCDREKTQRVLSNIVTNAIKYSKNGGEVVIGYARGPRKHVISVKDGGVGIPAAEQAHIFQPHFRASNAEHSLIAGTGIGLSLVKELMNKQGGDVSFSSKEGEGTIFFIEIKDR